MQTSKTKGRHARLRYHSKDTAHKIRKVYRIANYGHQYEFGVHNNSFQNLERGLMERVFFVKNGAGQLVPCPEPDKDAFGSSRMIGYVKRIADKVPTAHKITRQKFLSHYTGARFSLYQKAVDSLSDNPICVRDSHLKTFVKAEKINLTKKPDAVPRVIQPRSPRYNVMLGCFLKELEHPIYKALDSLWGSPTIMKCRSVESMGEIIRQKFQKFRNPVAIGFDASRFDQHVSVDALKYEHKLYKLLYHYDEELCWLLKLQVHNYGTAYASDGYINYTVDGKRMSGDMNTSLGNCFLAATITKDFVDQYGIEAELVNNGDDNVLICSEDDEEVVEKHLYNHWLHYGFEVVAEKPVRILEQIEFCQMKPVFDGTSYIMVRDPVTTMSKDAYSITPFHTPTAARKWMAAVGECGLALTGGIPIVQEYYKSFIRHGLTGSKVKESKDFDSGLLHLSKLSKRTERAIKDSTRYSFYLAFGYTPDEQLAMERYYAEFEPLMEKTTPGEPASSPLCLLLHLNHSQITLPT